MQQRKMPQSQRDGPRFPNDFAKKQKKTLDAMTIATYGQTKAPPL